MRSGRAPNFFPQFLGLGIGFDLIITAENREPEARFLHLELVDHEIPGKLDSFFFEIIAEREIAEHLEKRVMAGGAADLVEIVVLAAGAKAFLRRNGAGIVAFVDAEEHVLELVHAGIDEEQRRVVGREQGG